MLGALRSRWFAVHSRFLGLQNQASDTGAVISSLSKTLRLCLQSLVLGLGALLVIKGDMTAGMMIAGSILMGRVLSPIDQLIAVWKQWSGAKLAYRRLDALLQAFAPQDDGMTLPAPKGQVSFEHVSAGPPGQRNATLQQVSFSLAAGEVLGVLGPRGRASPPWPESWWACGRPSRVRCASTGPIFIAGIASNSARTSAICPRTSSCSAAALPRTSPGFARPIRKSRRRRAAGRGP